MVDVIVVLHVIISVVSSKILIYITHVVTERKDSDKSEAPSKVLSNALLISNWKLLSFIAVLLQMLTV